MAIATTPAPLLGEPLPVELMNTIWADREGIHDALATAADSVAWIKAVAGRPDVDVPDLAGWSAAANPDGARSAHENLRRLRDAARCLAARLTQDPRAAVTHPVDCDAAVAAVNDLASGVSTWPVLDWPEGGAPEISRARAASPGAVLVADLARSTIDLLAGTGRSDLRACLAPGCVLYFVKQHPRREWCSDACGNRARQARHYQRNRPQTGR